MSNDTLRMFRYPAMIKSAAFCAATFALLSVLMKNNLVIIPEVTEIRLCNALAVSYGLWFGPAGAWGCALGNLIGDMGGSLTWLSFPGFLGNFLSAWVPYKLWRIMGARYGEEALTRPDHHAVRRLPRYLLAGLGSVISCCAVLAPCFTIAGLMSLSAAFIMLALNNAAATLLGLALFMLMGRLPRGMLPYWRELMDKEPL